MKLEEICGYLPYKLKVALTKDYSEELDWEDWGGKEEDYKEGTIWQVAGYGDDDLYIPCGDSDLDIVLRKGNAWINISWEDVKPILRPLSDLTKPVLPDGKIPLVELAKIQNQLQLFQKLYEWHFDIFGLIEKGEAIDINTLKL